MEFLKTKRSFTGSNGTNDSGILWAELIDDEKSEIVRAYRLINQCQLIGPGLDVVEKLRDRAITNGDAIWLAL